MSRRSAVALVVLACLGSSTSSMAQKAPELGYVFPAGGRAGTTVDVRLGGYDFTPDMQFFCLAPGVRLTALDEPGEPIIQAPPYWFGPKGRSTAMPIPREVKARFELPADLPPGPIRWQVANANGSSATAVFEVGDGVELVEDRWRDDLQPLPALPVTVSGRLGRIAEVDRYSFVAASSGPVSVDLVARRLGADLHAVIEILDAIGRRIADVADTEGFDAALTFAAVKGERYVIGIRDVDFRGHRSFVYRVRVTPGPRVCVAVPASGRRGETRDVELVGYGVATGAARLESVTRCVTFPTAEASSIRYRLQTPHGDAASFELGVSELLETVEDEGGGDEARRLQVPGAVTGRLGGGDDRWIFEAGKGDVLGVELEARAIGSPLDVTLGIVDAASGKELAKNDDAKGSTDAALDFTAPEAGSYEIVVGDVSGLTGSPRSIYRLVVRRVTSDIELTMPQQLTLAHGGKVELVVKAVRRGGFSGEVSLSLTGLPDGVTAPAGLKIAGDKGELKIPIECAKDAATSAALLRVEGSVEIDGRAERRVALAGASGNLCARRPRDSQVDACVIATTMPPPLSFDVVGRQTQRAVHRGTTYPAPIVLERADGFDGEVELHMLAKQARHRQGIRGPAIVVPPGVSAVEYPIFLPEWLETDRTSRMVLLAMAKVRDPKGNLRYLTTPITSRITIILVGALLNISHAGPAKGVAGPGELTVTPGSVFEFPLRVRRSVKLREDVRVELAPSSEPGDLLSSEAVVLGRGEDAAVLRITSARDPRLVGDWKIAVRATATVAGKWPAISLVEVPVPFVAGE